MKAVGIKTAGIKTVDLKAGIKIGYF